MGTARSKAVIGVDIVDFQDVRRFLIVPEIIGQLPVAVGHRELLPCFN